MKQLAYRQVADDLDIIAELGRNASPSTPVVGWPTPEEIAFELDQQTQEEYIIASARLDQPMPTAFAGNNRYELLWEVGREVKAYNHALDKEAIDDGATPVPHETNLIHAYMEGLDWLEMDLNITVAEETGSPTLGLATIVGEPEYDRISNEFREVDNLRARAQDVLDGITDDPDAGDKPNAATGMGM